MLVTGANSGLGFATAAALLRAGCQVRLVVRSTAKGQDTVARLSDSSATRSIVLAASAAAQTGIANHEAIAAAKGGVMGLVRSAATYGAKGVRVNAVAPGLVRAQLTSRLTDDERQAEASRQLHVLGRLGEGDDVAACIAWLLDPDTSWVTGQVIGVDGGLGQVRGRPR